VFSERESITIVAASPIMRDALSVAARVAPTEANVVIGGESGTGKNLLARWIHDRSGRAAGPYVTIDCGALPENLLEAELFGYERGAFTGAVVAKPGRLEAAQGGTLVLDEVTALTTQAQAKLLRVIEERRFARLGGKRSLALDMRLITLAGVNLHDAVARRTFRADLFHRLNVVHIEIAPLRDRPTDILPLAKHFLARACARHARPPLQFSSEALEILKNYDFPGNARELMHAVERATLLVEDETVGVALLPDVMTSAAAAMRGRERKPTLAELEAVYIREILTHTRGQKKRAAEILGISRKNLYEKMQAYGIPYRRK
jgi:two-component system, NtrC family, response regulator AtoC